MAREVYHFSVTVPVGTSQAAPQVTALTMPQRVVARLIVIVPPGPRGSLGFQFSSGGVSMIPINPGQFLVRDDVMLEYDLTDYLTTGAWQLIAYNTGGNSHTLEIEFHVDPLPDPASVAGPALLSSDALSG